MSNTPASNARPIGLTLAGLPHDERGARSGREDWLPWLLLLVPGGSLVFAALLIIALCWITGSPAPAPDRASFGADAEVGTESVDIEESQSIGGVLYHELQSPGRLH